jgi:hypothetical protein
VLVSLFIALVQASNLLIFLLKMRILSALLTVH